MIIILRTVIINFRISVFTMKYYYIAHACIELYTQHYAYNGVLNDQVVDQNILNEINNTNNCCDDGDNLSGAFHLSEISCTLYPIPLFWHFIMIYYNIYVILLSNSIIHISTVRVIPYIILQGIIRICIA